MPQVPGQASFGRVPTETSSADDTVQRQLNSGAVGYGRTKIMNPNALASTDLVAMIWTPFVGSTHKAPSMGGLMRGPTAPPPSLQGVVHGYIIKADWDALQPSGSGAINTTLIDDAVTAVRAYNNANSRTVTNGVISGGTTLTSTTAAFVAGDVGQYVISDNIPGGTKIASRTNGTTVVLDTPSTNGSGLTITIGRPQRLRLRIEAGIHAPTSVKAMSGGEVSVSSPGGSIGTVPRWWTSAVQTAYSNFVGLVATYVDPIPEVLECTVGLCMLFFGEVFIRFPTQNTAALSAAGLTTTNDLAAMKVMLDAHAAFTQTITILDCNQYQNIDAIAPQGLTFTTQLMDYAVAHFRGLCFTNASLTDSGNTTLYNLMQTYGPKGSGVVAISFQTMPTVVSLPAVLARAVGYGATAVELPSGASAADVSPYDPQLQANDNPPPWPWR